MAWVQQHIGKKSGSGSYTSLMHTVGSPYKPPKMWIYIDLFVMLDVYNFLILMSTIYEYMSI
jgi:hypothetical protein